MVLDLLPCPADLRKLGIQNSKLTIANMTSQYLCRISLANDEALKEITFIEGNEVCFIDRVLVHKPEQVRGDRCQRVEMIYNNIVYYS